MKNAAWLVVGAIITAGLGYASWWVYLEVQQQVRGTLISGFGIFVGVMGAFALLSAAQTLLNVSARLLGKMRNVASGRWGV